MDSFKLTAMVAILGWAGAMLLGGRSAATDDQQDVLECCMLKRLADGCAKREFDPVNPSASSMPLSPSEQDRVSNWRSVGNSGNGDACKAMINGSELGCSYNSYWESDAIVACQ